MSSSSVATPPSVSTAQQPAGGKVSPEVIQRLIDQVAGFNLFVVPDGGNASGASADGTTGFVFSETLHRFDVVLQRPSAQGVQASNAFGETVGKLDIRWFMIADDVVPRQDGQPLVTRLSPASAQRLPLELPT